MRKKLEKEGMHLFILKHLTIDNLIILNYNHMQTFL